MQMQFGGAPAPAGGAISRHPAQSLDPSHRSPFALAQPPAPLAAPAAAPYGQGTPSVSVARPETPGVFSLADWEEMLPTELLTGPAGAGMDPQLAAALAMRAGGGLPSRSC